MRGWSDNARIGTAVAVMTTACASLGCGAAAAPDVGETVQTDERPPNIVWIVADELRPPLEQLLMLGEVNAAGDHLFPQGSIGDAGLFVRRSPLLPLFLADRPFEVS